MVGASVSWYGVFDNCTCTLGQQSSEPLFKYSLFEFHTVYAGAYWHKMYGICACACAEQRNRHYFRHVLFDCFGKIFLSFSVLPV